MMPFNGSLGGSLGALVNRIDDSGMARPKMMVGAPGGAPVMNGGGTLGSMVSGMGHPFNPTPALGQPNSFGQAPSAGLQDRFNGLNPMLRMMFVQRASQRGIDPLQAYQNAVWFRGRQA